MTTASARLLAAVAEALNDCAEAGLRPKLKHGAVYTTGGYVLPIRDDDGNRPWVTRTLTWTEFPGGDDDDL